MHGASSILSTSLISKGFIMQDLMHKHRDTELYVTVQNSNGTTWLAGLSEEGVSIDVLVDDRLYSHDHDGVTLGSLHSEHAVLEVTEV